MKNKKVELSLNVLRAIYKIFCPRCLKPKVWRQGNFASSPKYNLMRDAGNYSKLNINFQDGMQLTSNAYSTNTQHQELYLLTLLTSNLVLWISAIFTSSYSKKKKKKKENKTYCFLSKLWNLNLILFIPIGKLIFVSTEHVDVKTKLPVSVDLTNRWQLSWISKIMTVDLREIFLPTTNYWLLTY